MSFRPDSSKQTQYIFLAEKLRRFLILHYVLITGLSWKPIWKIPWQIPRCLINVWGTFESNYYQGKQSYRTVAKIAKNFTMTGINNYVQSFYETRSKLWRHDLWWSFKRKNLRWIRYGIPPTLTFVQETLLTL